MTQSTNLTTQTSPRTGALLHAADGPDAAWWRHAVIYQVYPRSWADSNGDGVGDLPGITSRLPYLRDLGVDALWLSPFYRSPMADAGYDVADYRDIDPLFGSLADAEALIARAGDLGLRVIVDLVPNHTSDEHAWFQEALASEPGSPARARYIFRDGSGPTGDEPPNDWVSVFHGPAWTQVSPGETDASGALVRPGQWYLHLFDSKQPDLDWTNPEVRAEFEDILRFWVERGVDGFRVDVAHGLVKAPGLPAWSHTTDIISGDEDHKLPTNAAPMWDQDGVHEIYRAWRRVLEDANPTKDPAADKILCAEAWVQPLSRNVLYTRPDEMHQAFNFAFLTSPWHADALRAVVATSLAAGDSVGAPTTWVLSNHDVVRHATRLAWAQGEHLKGIGIGDPVPDAALGLRRARAATTLMLGLPGSAYLYQGEELGLPESAEVPDELRQDPAFLRSEGTERGRDGCRIPMPWEGDAPAAGFNTTGQVWLPQPASYAELAVDRQVGVAGSTLELYRTLLRLRRELDLGTAELLDLDGLPDTAVGFMSLAQDGSRVAFIANLGEDDLPLPAGEVLVRSDDDRAETGADAGRPLPLDASAWVRLPA
ncbi:glycoside hydrolase family 13 protein [Agilicoccus flavus]|uniref:glycoside hydrolase family 13 protein n=1 Tax=Agilicoccus flavus TaxID=2775968 RepID=UPI001CF6E51E|nr:glycoside hydrolase family 13 protein [Agilicoccus flavus]